VEVLLFFVIFSDLPLEILEKKCPKITLGIPWNLFSWTLQMIMLMCNKLQILTAVSKASLTHVNHYLYFLWLQSSAKKCNVTWQTYTKHFTQTCYCYFVFLIYIKNCNWFTWKKNIVDSLAKARTGSITRVPSAIWIITNCQARSGSVAGLGWTKDCVKRTLILGRILTTMTYKIKQQPC
jgi:hypothetical protein